MRGSSTALIHPVGGQVVLEARALLKQIIVNETGGK